MNVEHVERHLVTTASALSGLVICGGRRQGAPFVRITDPHYPSVWAEISTHGVSWVCLAVTGGFLLIDICDDDQDVVRRIDEYFEVASAFLVSRPPPVGRVFPSLVVEAPGGRRILTRSLVSDLRALLGVGPPVP